MDKIIEELKEYLELEGTELGECCEALISLRGYSDYFANDGFEKILDEEIKTQLQNFKDNREIVVRERTVPEHVVKTKDLEWN